jgi:hypothetical protein
MAGANGTEGMKNDEKRTSCPSWETNSGCGQYFNVKGKDKVVSVLNRAPHHEDLSFASLNTTT